MGLKKESLIFLFKIAFSAAVITYFLTSQTSFSEIREVLLSADAGILLLAFSLHILGLLISAIRWQILIKAQGDVISLRHLIQSYLVAKFFDNFMPTRIGGDVIRIWDGREYSQSLVKSTAIIVIERLTGIIVLFAFALSASLIRLEMAREFPLVWAALGIGATGLAFIFFFFLPPAGRLLQKIPEKGFSARIKEKIIAFRKAAVLFGSRKKALGAAFIWALLLQINVVVYYFLIGRALNLSIPFLDYFIFIPILHLILLIPISINGLGLRELSLSKIFGFYGLASAAALSFAWIEVLFILVVGSTGAFIFVLRKKKLGSTG